MSLTRWFLMGGLLAAVLSACGSESAVDPADGSASLPVHMAGDEVMVTCGDTESWGPAVMADGVPGVLTDAEARSTFQRILDDPRTGEEARLSLFPDGIDVEWRVLHDGGDSLTIGLGQWTRQGPARTGAPVLELEREGGAWVPGGWGDCGLTPALKPGLDWAEVTAIHAGDTNSLVVQVTERECTSGRDPDPFLHEPVVVETAKAVTLYWTTTPVTDDANCQGNPPVERTVHLDEPLGSRPVLDGSTYPPRPVGHE